MDVKIVQDEHVVLLEIWNWNLELAINDGMFEPLFLGSVAPFLLP